MNAGAPARLVDALRAAAIGVASLLVLLPWPKPSISLREACAWEEAGRFAFGCDLEAASRSTGTDWLKRGIHVYEDGILLRWANRAADVRRENPGSYQTSGRLLTLASLDRTDVRTNGRKYIARPVELDPLGLSLGSRRALVALCLAAAVVAFGLWWPQSTPRWGGAGAIAVAALAVQLVSVVAEAPVPVDAGDVLPAAEAITRGAVPYRSLLYNLYTPLGAYQFSFWGRLWMGASAPPYWWYLCLVLVCECVCAGLVFAFLRNAGVAVGLAALASLSYLSMTIWFDGGRVLHEPLYLWPVILSAVLALSRRAFAAPTAGFLAAHAFLTKQYGGFGLAGFLGSVLVAGERRRRRMLACLLGFSAGLLLFGLLLLARGVDWRAFVLQSLAPSYPRRYESVWLEIFLRQCPIALPAVVVPFLPGFWSRPEVRVVACFGLASCLPFLIRQQQYYFLNVCPWLFILFALAVDRLRAGAGRWRVGVGALCAWLLLTMPIRGAAAQARWLEQETRADQLRRARLMTLAWPASQPTLVLALPSFVHLTRYRSPDESALGYRFVNEHTAEQLLQGFAHATGVWIDPKGMYARGTDSVLRGAGTSVDEQLARYGFQKQLVVEERFELWTKSP